jgi:hypothetical protein
MKRRTRFYRTNRMNKKGFEVATSFIVMLVLSITVFAFGLVFIKKLFSEAGEIKAQLDKDSEERIRILLDRGERVAFPISTKDIKSDQVAVFGLGIVNVKNDPTTFHIDVQCTVAVDRADKAIPDGCTGKWTFAIADFTLEKNEQKIVPIAIQPPKSPAKREGTYGFTVTVTDIASSTIPYGGAPKQIYVNII